MKEIKSFIEIKFTVLIASSVALNKNFGENYSVLHTQNRVVSSPTAIKFSPLPSFHYLKYEMTGPPPKGL